MAAKVVAGFGVQMAASVRVFLLVGGLIVKHTQTNEPAEGQRLRPPPRAPARKPPSPAKLGRGCTRPGCERVPSPFLLDLAHFHDKIWETCQSRYRLRRLAGSCHGAMHGALGETQWP